MNNLLNELLLTSRLIQILLIGVLFSLWHIGHELHELNKRKSDKPGEDESKKELSAFRRMFGWLRKTGEETPRADSVQLKR